MVLLSQRSATHPEWKLERSGVATMMPSAQWTDPSEEGRASFPGGLGLLNASLIPTFNTPNTASRCRICHWWNSFRQRLRRWSLWHSSTKRDALQPGWWLKVYAHRLTIQLCARCAVSAYNGTTATHYLPISMFILYSRLVPELLFFLVCSTVPRRKIPGYGCFSQ
jgi:hypothetical protein